MLVKLIRNSNKSEGGGGGAGEGTTRVGDRTPPLS